MVFNNISIRAKLGGLLLVALSILAITRGVGLAQLGGYLDRMNGFINGLDTLHLQLQSVQAAQIDGLYAGRNDAASRSTQDAQIRALRGQLDKLRGEWSVVQSRERSIMYSTYAAMLVVILVIGSVIYWFLMSLVVRPLQGVADVANVVAAGDLTGRIDIQRRDEIGKVMQSLRGMNDSLSGLIGKIRAVSHAIGADSEAVASASSRLTHHVGAQTEFFRHTAVSLRGLADAVSSNAESASNARKLAAQARSVAIKGGEEVGQAVETMTRISASSKKIVDIVSIIDGITFQTNILALNAAVEAARAGEQGRGFAVVAAEVRSLAQRSAGAAKEIAALINESVRELNQGSGIVEMAGATMTQIVTGARAVDDIMAQIAAASAEQRQVIEQVRATVDNIDQTSEQQSLLTQAADAAASMRQQAQDLIAAVSVFRLNADGVGGPATAGAAARALVRRA